MSVPMKELIFSSGISIVGLTSFSLHVALKVEITFIREGCWW